MKKDGAINMLILIQKEKIYKYIKIYICNKYGD